MKSIMLAENVENEYGKVEPNDLLHRSTFETQNLRQYLLDEIKQKIYDWHFIAVKKRTQISLYDTLVPLSKEKASRDYEGIKFNDCQYTCENDIPTQLPMSPINIRIMIKKLATCK